MANKKADLRESNLIAAFIKGSKGAQERLLKTKFGSRCETITLRLGRSQLTPLRNALNKLCIPKDISSTGPLYADNAATYTLIVEQDKPCSKRLCRKSKRLLKVQS